MQSPPLSRKKDEKVWSLVKKLVWQVQVPDHRRRWSYHRLLFKNQQFTLAQATALLTSVCQTTTATTGPLTQPLPPYTTTTLNLITSFLINTA